MVKEIELIDGVEQTIEEKLEVIRLKINELITHLENEHKDFKKR